LWKTWQDCSLTTSSLLLSKSTARPEPTSLSSVSLPITRTEMPDPWPPLFLYAIYLSPAIAYSIAREPLARVSEVSSTALGVVIRELVSHPRFIHILVSRSCPDKPYFGLRRYFNELIVIETLSRSHESFLWYGIRIPLHRGLPQKDTPVNVIRFQINRMSDFAIYNGRETTSIKTTLPRNFKLMF